MPVDKGSPGKCTSQAVSGFSKWVQGSGLGFRALGSVTGLLFGFTTGIRVQSSGCSEVFCIPVHGGYHLKQPGSCFEPKKCCCKCASLHPEPRMSVSPQANNSYLTHNAPPWLPGGISYTAGQQATEMTREFHLKKPGKNFFNPVIFPTFPSGPSEMTLCFGFQDLDDLAYRIRV